MSKKVKLNLVKLTTPAIVTLVGYAIIVFIVMLPVDMYTYNNSTHQQVKQEYNFGHRLLIALLLLFPFILSVYSVNCMMVGNCTLWSWVIALVTLLWAILITVTTAATGSFSLANVMTA